MKTTIKIKTWSCQCGYHQDCEPTQENQDLLFNLDPKFKVSDLKVNECPACALKGQLETLTLETDEAKKTTIIIMGEDELATLEKLDEITKQKRTLTKAEKDVLKAKIQADVLKFSAMQ